MTTEERVREVFYAHGFDEKIRTAIAAQLQPSAEPQQKLVPKIEEPATQEKLSPALLLLPAALDFLLNQ